MIEINRKLLSFLKTQFPNRILNWYFPYKYKNESYIQIKTALSNDKDIHYEYYHGHVELHLEGKYHEAEYQEFVNLLRQQSYGMPLLSWMSWQGKENFRCQIDKPTDSWKDVMEAFKAIIEIFDPIITQEEVTLEQLSLNKIFSPEMNLSIPDYQRIYCWEKEQVTTLLHDIENIFTKEYFLGNIILHKRYDGEQKRDVLDIVDGQQRLVTLALIHHFAKENNDEDCGLLNCSFLSIEAQQHVYDNAQIIQDYLKEESKKKRIKNNLSKLTFGVLTIDQEHLDLAFTFFTNTNSRGKRLTDYDLLKPHHLRYIPSDYQLQQQALATQWDKMINQSKKKAENPDQRRDAPYIHVLELLLYRLRKWSRKKDCKETDRFVYTEYKTAKIIEEIPPFGENFDFYEPIQGGQHFFEYVEHFMQKYMEFTSIHEIVHGNNINSKEGVQPNVYDVLRENFTGYSDRWYRYVMEALVFCYYLKFGNSFISEATLSIVRYISKIRFDKAKAYEPTIVKYARDSEIVLMIEQATSPTFFLAEIESKIERLPKIEDFEGVRKSFLESCHKVSEILSKKSNSVSYQDYFQNRYERITPR